MHNAIVIVVVVGAHLMHICKHSQSQLISVNRKRPKNNAADAFVVVIDAAAAAVAVKTGKVCCDYSLYSIIANRDFSGCVSFD